MMHNISVGGNQMLKVTGDVFENIDGDLHSEVKKDRNTVGHSGFVSQSESTEFH